MIKTFQKSKNIPLERLTISKISPKAWFATSILMKERTALPSLIKTHKLKRAPPLLEVSPPPSVIRTKYIMNNLV